MTMRRKTFINTVEKGESAGNQHFLLFPDPRCFLLFVTQVSCSKFHYNFHLHMLPILDWAKNLSFGIEKICILYRLVNKPQIQPI